MPREFLMEVLEWNEALEEAREAAPGSPAREALGALEDTLEERRKETLALLADTLEPLPERGAKALVTARRLLNAVRTLTRTTRELEALRLEQAASS